MDVFIAFEPLKKLSSIKIKSNRFLFSILKSEAQLNYFKLLNKES